jgi:exopolyphosphatase
MRLDYWLKQCISRADENYTPIYVLGNQAADADSIISSLIWAWFCNKFKIFNLTTNNIYLPIITCKRDELVLRKDILYLLMKDEINPDDLLYYNEVNLIDDFRVILMDHNRLDSVSQQFGKNGVLAIIDHHKDDGQKTESLRIIDTTIGSTCSLLTHILFNKDSGLYIHSNILEDTENYKIIADWLLHVIMIDTKNLSGRYNQADITAVKVLLQLLSYDDIHRAKIYTTMHKYRIDTTGLSLIDLFNKDFKQYEHNSGVIYGMSTIPATFKHCLSLSNYEPSQLLYTIQSYCQDKQLNMFIAKFYGKKRQKMLIYIQPNLTNLTATVKSVFQELVGYGKNSDIVINFITKVPAPEILVFTGNKKIKETWSRKIVQPKVDIWLSQVLY